MSGIAQVEQTRSSDRSAADALSGAESPESLLSVIVTVTERPDHLGSLYRELAEALSGLGRPLEFLFVLEPRYRDLAAPLRSLAEEGKPIRVLGGGHAVGEAALLRLGAERSRGEILLTLPAYHRVVASGLPDLVQRVVDGADMAVARRWPRRDTWVNRLQTRAFHALLGGLARGQVRDVASGVRAMRREVLLGLPLYGDFFRFLPLLAIHEGYRVTEVDLPQHASDRRTRVYSLPVYLHRLIDLLGVFFLMRFTYKPLRFFGFVGGAFAFAGGAILAVMAFQRLGGQGIADRPLLLLGVLLVTLGVQAIALGLVGEIIVHLNIPGRRLYRVLPAPDDER